MVKHLAARLGDESIAGAGEHPDSGGKLSPVGT